MNLARLSSSHVTLMPWRFARYGPEDLEARAAHPDRRASTENRSPSHWSDRSYHGHARRSLARRGGRGRGPALVVGELLLARLKRRVVGRATMHVAHRARTTRRRCTRCASESRIAGSCSATARRVSDRPWRCRDRRLREREELRSRPRRTAARRLARGTPPRRSDDGEHERCGAWRVFGSRRAVSSRAYSRVVVAAPRSLPLVALALVVAVLVIAGARRGRRRDLGRRRATTPRSRRRASPPPTRSSAATLPAWWEGAGLGVPLAAEPSHGAAVSADVDRGDAARARLC